MDDIKSLREQLAQLQIEHAALEKEYEVHVQAVVCCLCSWVPHDRLLESYAFGFPGGTFTRRASVPVLVLAYTVYEASDALVCVVSAAKVWAIS